MRRPWSAGKVVGVVALALFVTIATVARVDAARQPEREWKPSLAELPDPGAVALPELVAAPVSIGEDGESLSIALGTGLSQPADAAVVTLPRLPPDLVVVLDAAKAEGRVRWQAATSEYTLASFAADGTLRTIARYPTRAPDGDVSLTFIMRDDGALSVWAGSDRLGSLVVGPVGVVRLGPADELRGTRAQLGQVRP